LTPIHPRRTAIPTPRNPLKLTTATTTAPTTAPTAASSGHTFATIPPPPHTDVPAWRVHLLLPHGRRRQNIEYVRISRTTRLPEPIRRHGVNLAPPARAVLDTCTWCLEAPDDVMAEAFIETVVLATVSSGLASLSDLEQELDQAPRRHTKALRQALVRARTRERDAAAHRLFDDLARHGPLGLLRHVAIYGDRRRIAVAEALWPSRALAVTIDAGPNERAELGRLGFEVVEISAHDLTANTTAIVNRVTAALAARPEATLPTGVALLPLGQPVPDPAAEEGVPGRVQLAPTTTPTLPPRSGLRVRGPAYSGAF
ncbi:hypothetical protein KDL01_40385, partial [Actinospica durhamensis]